MALGPCCMEVKSQRVQLVEDWSQHIAFLLEFLYQVGALTEEDVSLVQGGESLGNRERMRLLLDVLYGRGEEACRAFLHSVKAALKEHQGASLTNQENTHSNQLELLRNHKEILGREHSPADYLSIRGGHSNNCGLNPFTEITLSQRQGYAVPLRYQHETTEVSDAFRKAELRPEGQGQACEFSKVCQSLLFSQGDGVTLLSGVAGSGKTTLVRRLVHEWAANEESQKVVFSLSFRELNLVSEPQSLQELLCVHYNHLRPILSQILTSDFGRILLILDGLDEFRFPLDFSKTPKCSNPEIAQSMGEMVVNLIKGSLLPGISLLLTSRPHAISKVPPQLVSVFYTVLGFSEDQQRQYFLQTCRTRRAADKVLQYVSSHQPLLLMCHIPAFCWIVATALQDSAEAQDSTPLQESSPISTHKAADNSITMEPKTMFTLADPPQGPGKPATVTEIYCCFLKAILVFHGEGREGTSRMQRLQEAPGVLRGMRSLLRDLGALAFQGLLERRFLFDAADLGGLELNHSELSQAFLVEILREDHASLACERSFHFIHTSVQEFLAALYYVLQSLSGVDPFSSYKPGLPSLTRRAVTATMRWLLGHDQLVRRHIKKVFRWSESHQSGHLDLFCRFVSGLFVPSTRQILDGVFPRQPRKLFSGPTSCPAAPSTPTPAPPFLLGLLHSQLQRQELRPERQVNVCHCLYEALDPGLPGRLQGWLRLLAQQAPARPTRSEQDWSELAFLLELSPSLRELNLEAQGLGSEALHRLLPVLPLFSTLRLGQNPLGPEGAAILSQALRSPDCRIERLWVVDTGLGCVGMKVLAEGLRDNHTVVDLRMAINGIGDEGAYCLAELLRTNHTLRDIRLRDNKMTDNGAEFLMTALKENTMLECLWLFDNKFSKDGVRRLKEFAKGRASLDIKVCV
ncbi:protein NLRC3-like [Arapaima gigas]